jgi:hypothetical protein
MRCWNILAISMLFCGTRTFAETPTLFQPDPLSVQRFEKGYRYPQAGWIVLHIEGEPYERGYQHGRLLAPEIVDTMAAFAAEQSHRDPATAWRQSRTLANALFLRKFDPEYLEEMKGIADGASAAGAKYDGRPVDITDVVILNCWAELMTLDNALEALPTGLEGRVFPRSRPRAMPPPQEGHCSAFAATGPATADGTIVFGHITMFGLMSSHHFKHSERHGLLHFGLWPARCGNDDRPNSLQWGRERTREPNPQGPAICQQYR